MTPLPEKIQARLQKIKAMVDGATTDGELQAATNQMNKILLEYNLEESEIDTDLRDDVKVDELPVDVLDVIKKNEGKWVSSLYSVLASHNLCQITITSGPIQNGRRVIRGTKKINIYGSPTNIEVVKYMAAAIIPQLQRMEPQYWAEYQYSLNGYEGSKRGAWRRAWYLGAVHGINSKMEDQVRKVIEVNPNLNALVHVHDAAVNKFIKEKHPKLGKSRGGRVSSMDGYGSGQKAGKSVSLNKGVGSGGSSGVLGQRSIGAG
jgi:hypothetical protein